MQATLAAYDIAAQLRSLTVSCYTFGAPRTGDRAFADDYSRMVEDTWHIINGESRVLIVCIGLPGAASADNGHQAAACILLHTADQDLVTRGGKLAVFKRPGHRVLLQQGDMLVGA